MLINYIKIAYRNLIRHRFYTFINVLGLTVGLTCSFLLFLYIRDELSFDQHYENSEDIYRVASYVKISSQELEIATSPGLLSPTLKKDYPEVLETCRIIGMGKAVITLEAQKFYQEDMFFADSTTFQVLSHNFLRGDANEALKAPQSIVLTKSLAEKLFGSSAAAYGKTFKIDNNEKPFTVTGIIEDMPKNTTLRFSALVSVSSLDADNGNLSRWFSLNGYTYVQLKKNTDYKAFEDKLAVIQERYAAQEIPNLDVSLDFIVQPIADIHFNSHLEEELGESGNLGYIYILTAIAIFVLLIASINYMNLATARSTGRAREVGIRKVLGSHRSQLMFQFLVESGIVAVGAFLLSLGAIELALPWFNDLANKALSINHGRDWNTFGAFFLIAFSVGLFSGVYPAFFLSRFNPVIVLKGKFLRASGQGVWLRKSLVVLQFAISITMIIGTWIVYQQLNYVHNKDLGFNPEQTLIIDLNNDSRQKLKVFEQKLMQNPNITKVSGASAIPGAGELWANGIMVEQDGEMKEKVTPMLYADYNYLDLIGVELKEGRGFELNSDSTQAVIINEAFAKEYGWKEAIGKPIINFDDVETDDVDSAIPRKVIGVMKDFHISSLHKTIEPLAVFPFGSGFSARRLLIRFQTDNIENTLAFIKKTYQEIDAQNPYEPYFLDQKFAIQYQADQTRGKIFFAFSLLTIFIACLGLLGLAAFTAEIRTKEIGIRKVLGASISSILVLVSREFLILVLIANPIAFVTAYFVMNNWLKNFAYRTEIIENWYIFIFAAIVALFISILTVSYQAYRAATINPVNVLRNE